jgi:hypothetical protein
MAKQPSPKGGMSRVRFIMLEAEIPEGDLSQITTAIQNALKPATVIQQRLSAQASTPALADSSPHGEAIEAEVELEVAAVEATPSKSNRAPRVRKPTTPEVLDLDLTSGVSLESFAGEHPPTSEPERNLVVAVWFKEHRDTPAITAAHVYTAYRHMKWPAGFADFSWPLRALKKDQLVTSPGRGEFAVNHLGIDRVHRLKSG